MGWTRLYPRRTLEEELQVVFDNWGGKQHDCTLAGVPDWLTTLGQPEERRGFPREGYSFRPDVLWSRHVAELKSAEKFEPIALAEALHHAQCLTMERGVTVTPIVVTSYSSWLRRALQFLTARGFEDHHIRYIEVGHLAEARGNEHFLWFDEPNARWEPAGAPPRWFAGRGGSWHYVPATRSWHALRTAQADRPVVPEGPVEIVTPIEGTSTRFLFWQGTYATAGTFYLYDAERSDDTPSPPTLFDALSA